MNELINKIQRKEIVIVERKEIIAPVGGAIAYAENESMDEFLEHLGNAIKPLEAMGVDIGDIEIITDGEKIAAKMKMGK